MGSFIGMSLALLAAIFFIFVRITGGKKEADKCDDYFKGAAWFFTFIGGTFGLVVLFSLLIKNFKNDISFLIYIVPIASVFISYKFSEWLISTENKNKK